MLCTKDFPKSTLEFQQNRFKILVHLITHTSFTYFRNILQVREVPFENLLNVLTLRIKHT